MEEDFVKMARNKELAYSKQGDMNKTLLDFYNQLKVAGAEFGYRTASEIRRFAAVAEAMGTTWENQEILDIVIMQKLLPKLHGSRRKLEPILKTLISLCLKPEEKLEEYLKQNPDTSEDNVLYPISLEKLQRMYRGLIDNGFTSYAEA
jgi:5-methylcytosine-specific restriction protein B